MEDMNLFKKCGHCKLVYRKTFFFNNKARYDGLSSQCKKCHQEDTSKRYNLLKQKCYEKYGSKCLKCGDNDFRVLQFDHINGGGAKELKSQIFGGTYVPSTYYKKVLEDNTNKFQLLCVRCNWIKKHEEREQFTRPDEQPITGELLQRFIEYRG